MSQVVAAPTRARSLARHVAWLTLFALIAGPLAVAEEIRWRRHTIDAENINEAAAIVDVDHDGKPDIIAGGFWYQSPDWKRHFVREVENIRGRNDDYSALPLDVNEDGWLDWVSVNYRSKSLYWVEHPGEQLGKTDKPWTRHVIGTPGASETGRLYDIDQDGKIDVLPNGTDFAAWYSVSKFKEDFSDQPMSVWLQHFLPDELAGHGIGFGDVNGDGRGDLVSPRGWAEAPEGDRNARWIFHNDFRLHADCGLPILVHDVDGDGDNDLIYGRGHNIGLYWLEQLAEAHRPLPEAALSKWTLHTIDTTWSQAHTVLLEDIDGDGAKDLIAGKRFLGHDGNDPGEYNPLIVAWYKFDRDQRTWSRQMISESSDIGFSLDAKAGDIDGDGDVDLVCATRRGTYLLENRRANERIDEDVPALTIGPQSYAKPADLSQVKEAEGRLRPIKSPLDWGLRRAHVLANMQRVMGPLPTSARRVPLNLRVVKTEELDKYVRHTIRYDSDPSNSVPAFLLVPKERKGRVPAMLCLHPTSPLGKLQVAGVDGKPSRFYAHELAERGYVCLVPDYPSFGDYVGYDFAKDAHESGTMRAIWDNIRGVDLLESLDFVDGDRIGAIGHSLGGHNSLFTAAFDERVRAVVTSCGFTAFHDYYKGDLRGWASDRYMPRITTQFENNPDKMPFDFPEIFGALAPRPVFISAPVRDDNFEISGVKKCVAAAGGIYKLHGKEANLHAIYPECEHDFPDEVRREAYAWLDRVFAR